ncbi:Uncharacterised protein g5553 [Pycnogonum litorale]
MSVGGHSDPGSLAETDICTYFETHGEDCDTLVIVRRVFAGISFIGCSFTILVALLFRKFCYSFVQRIVLYVSISALLISVGYLMEGFHPEEHWCKFQAFWITFSEWSLLLWVSFITVDLFVRAFCGKSTKNNEWIYVSIGVLLPILMASLPFISNAYGPAGPWCWITGRHKAYRFGIWYGPLFGVILILVATNVIIFVRMKGQVEALGTFSSDHARKKEELKEGMNLLKFYPFIYLLLSILPCANRIHNALSPSPIYWLTVCHCVCSPLPGAIYALVLFLDEETRAKLTSWNEIKAHFTTCFTPRTIIQEYPTNVSDDTIELHIRAAQ